MNKEKNEKNYTKLYDKKGALIEIGSVISPVSTGHKKYVVVNIGNDDVPNIETFIRIIVLLILGIWAFVYLLWNLINSSI